jgi:chemotaxis protein CheD
MSAAVAAGFAREPAPPDCFATNHYYDRTHGINAVKVLPGEFYATQKDLLLVTVLGSCVAACIRDPDLGVGGMNHFMLPDADSAGPAGNAARYGSYAMEMLINHLIKLGAARERLEAKVFGGGSVIAGMTHANVGERNAEFVLKFLRTEGIRVVARDLNDVFPRKVYFFSASGRVMVKKLRNMHNNTIVEREISYRSRLVSEPAGGEVELFI